MGSFLDVVLPPFLLAVMAGAVVTTCIVITMRNLRTYAAHQAAARAVQNHVTGPAAKAALSAAKDVLTDVINDVSPMDLRERAISAYDQVSSVLNKN